MIKNKGMDKVIAQQYSVCLTCMIQWVQSSVLHTKKSKNKRMGAFYVIIAKEALVIDTTTN